MSISDVLMWRYFELLSDRSEEEIGALRAATVAGENPRRYKVLLASELVDRFHGPGAGALAAAHFDAVHRGGALPEQMPAVAITVARGVPVQVAQALKQAGLCRSTTDARRHIAQGGVKVDGERVANESALLPACGGEFVLQVGKRLFARVTVGFA
jgi:tyrosyl-tRNA synthetase